jgi:hypothetical protein
MQMLRNWLKEMRRYTLFSCVALLSAAGASRADDTAELKARLEAQEREIQQLKALIQSGAVRPAAADGDKKDDKKLDEKAVEKIIDSYLKEHPGSGMPSGVQTGYSTTTGFAIRSAPDPKYVNWSDDCRIPFELRIRGRIQADYYFYKVTDSRNHLTGVDTGNNTSGDFSQLEIKRMRLIFEGTAFDPNLRYHIQLDGSTRGITGLANGNGVTGTGGITPVTAGGTVVGGGGVPGGNGAVTADHAMRLFQAWVAYDWHPTGSEKGCGPDCPEGTYKYVPTVTAILGKLKPMINLEEYLGSANEQFVEYNMGNWFFDADDDNMLMVAGVQVKALDDRFFGLAYLTNGNETQIANLQMDDLPGFNFGFWYDFGGNWNEARKRWDLFGDCLSDIDYSCKPVLRVGGSANLVPMDRRSIYTNAELNRVRVVSDAPGGTSLVGLLNGGGVNPINNSPAGVGQFAVDAFDSYTFNAFAAAKWRGFSLYNEWWLRDLDNFRGRKGAGNAFNNPILYSSNAPGSAAGIASLFPSNQGIIDYGMAVQAGYFIVPKKVEICARYSFVRGQSGNINGNGNGPGQFTTTNIAGNTVRVVNGAFTNYSEADEYALGFNYFFKRHLLKWQTDISWYTGGGNPAAGGQSAAGFIPGVDGWQVRSQIQLAF